MQKNTLFFRRLALFSYFGLLSWMLIWYFALGAASGYSTLFVVLFWIVPLLLPAKGIIKGDPYTHAWANFVVMIYLLHGLTDIYASSDQWYFALIEIVLAAAMFVGCSFFARTRGRELGLGLKKKKEEKM